MRRLISTCCFLGVLLLFTSCEEDYIPPDVEAREELVVEGYVEAGEGSNPTFVLLTRTLPFVGTVDAQDFSSLFVRDADVVINDGDKDVRLKGLCLQDLPPALQEQAALLLGLELDSLALDICAYVDLFDELTREIGRTYSLRAEVEDKVLTATTTITRFVPLVDFRWDDPPGVPSDTIARLWVTIDDPEGTDYYRYLTGPEATRVIPPFQSVTDDTFFDGQELEFPLNKAEPRDADFDPDTFGFYTRGDSVTIKWCTMDHEHFTFWQTRDFSANSAGPFSSYTRVATNVDGGLGIFGGYAVAYYDLFAPPK